ncbi:hypothetical protein TNCV_4963681 [Trichonephila clavipes]|nr:hypothetical protein TNCV_4963681 [Trichonephila clavipes]
MWPGWVPGSNHVVRSWEKGAFSGKVSGGSGGRRKRRCYSGILRSLGYLRGTDLVFKLGLNYCDIFPDSCCLVELKCGQLEGEKDDNDDHRDEITDFVQSIPGFQKFDEDLETWMQKTQWISNAK